MILPDEEHERNLWLCKDDSGTVVAKGWSWIHLLYDAHMKGYELFLARTHWIGSNWIASDVPVPGDE